MKDRLKQLRKELNLTQEQFATKIDLNRSGYANIEVGNVKLIERNIKKICKEFNVNQSWLETGEGEMFKPLEDDKELLNFVINIMADKNEFVKKTFSTLAKLNESEWQVIEKIINGFKE